MADSSEYTYRVWTDDGEWWGCEVARNGKVIFTERIAGSSERRGAEKAKQFINAQLQRKSKAEAEWKDPHPSLLRRVIDAFK